MFDIITWFVSLAFALPMVATLFVYLLVQLIIKDRKKSVLLTVDISTIFYIFSVHFHLVTIFNHSFLLVIILILLLLLFSFYHLDYRKSKNPSMRIVFKKAWRLSFLLFLIVYVFLTIYGIATGVIKTVFL